MLKVSAMLVVVVAAATGMRPVVADDAASRRLAVVEAAVLFGLGNQEVASAAHVFLQVDGGPPLQELLTRFADVAKLKSVAECPHVESYGKQVPKPAAGDVVLNIWRVTLRSCGYCLGRSCRRSVVGHGVRGDLPSHKRGLATPRAQRERGPHLRFRVGGRAAQQ